MVHELRETKLFPVLTPEALEELKGYGEVLSLEPGQQILVEGVTNYPFIAVLEGQIRITKRVGPDEQLLAFHGPGGFVGEISMLTGTPSLASGRAVEASKVIRIENSVIRRLIAEHSDIGEMIMSAMSRRREELTAFLLEHEKLAALGKLSAGLAHELNNPASAARRAARELATSIADVQKFALRYDCRFTEAQREALLAKLDGLLQSRGHLDALDPLERADREEALSNWLERRDINNPWDRAPTLVSAGIGPDQLDQFTSGFDNAGVRGATVWLEATMRMMDLACQIENSTTRISDLVTAMKEYSYMDQAAFQTIDVHQGLDSTLKIFTPKLKNIEVVRDYHRDLPPICAYPGELNQVWTNLIDNSIYAMSGKGRLTIRTARDPEGVLIEIHDTGTGIPPEVKARLFEPFFTTKPVGQGTGLGLDISYRIVTNRHHGSIRVESVPGDTRFQVRLPLMQPKESDGQ